MTKAAAEQANPDYLRLILTARVYDLAVETPLTEAIMLSSHLQNHILLKREDLQPVFSFKIRGAYNKMVHLSEEERQRGVIAVSAGNHAQGVAMAAKKLGVPATIFMPLGTPAIKYRNVERLGARVIRVGEDFEAAKLLCHEYALQHQLTNIPPYDDPYVIAGQGTVAVEIMRQWQTWAGKQQNPNKPIDAIFCCVGGGGLIAGVVSYIKRIYPDVRVIGVETWDANSMEASLRAGHRVELSEVGLFADGAAVRVVGEEPFRVCYGNRACEIGSDCGSANSAMDIDGVDEMVLVSNDEICAAIKDVFIDTRTVLEPAGALGVAGLKKWVAEKGIVGGTFVAITSGANMNFDRLRFVADRAGYGEEREALISVTIPERPGSFVKLYECLAPRPITEFSYRYNDPDLAHIYLSFELDGSNSREAELANVFARLQENGMEAQDLTDNEIAKSHGRFMIGGRAKAENERLFQFTFPERPGALPRFLNGLRSGWNVSLWHYRNYGGDMGKVLAGIQVPPDQSEQFEKFLRDLHYPFTEETNNPVYTQFFKQ